MRVLLVTPFPVFPLTHGGSVRTYRLATGLVAAGCSVEVLGPWYPGTPAGSYERDDVRWHSHRLPVTFVAAIAPERLLPAAMAVSLQPSRLGPQRVLARLGEFDVAQFELPWLFGWAPHVSGRPSKVLSAHNVELDYVQARVHPRMRRLVASRARFLEGKAMRDSDLVVACTEADAHRLRTLYGAPRATEVIPNGFGTMLSSAQRSQLRASGRAELGIPPGDRVVVFVGGRAPHNVDALHAFKVRVLPRLGERWRLVTAGRVAPPGQSQDGVVLSLGYVENLEPILAVADVAVNPVSEGSGSSVKVADYLAAGLPVVSTPIGMRGFERLAESMTVADLDDFPAAIAAAVARPKPALTTIGELSPRALGERLAEAYEKLAARVGAG